MNKSLEVTKLSASYGHKKVLHEMSFCVNQGECLGLIGPNGSGKSTLLKALLGYLPLDTGEVRWNGKPTIAMDRQTRAQLISYVPQEAWVDSNFRVDEFLEMGQFPRLHQLTAEERQCVFRSIIDQFDLGAQLCKKMHQLSGGERQRVYLAQSLLQQPELLLLDEITNHLDIYFQLAILKSLRALPVTKVLALHDLNLAARFCDRLLLLAHGRLYLHGTPSEVLQSHAIEDLYQVKSQILQHPKEGHIILSFD